MRKPVLVMVVSALVLFAVGSVAFGAWDEGQVLGGPPREFPQARTSYCAERARYLQQLSTHDATVRALVVFRRHVMADKLREVIGQLPVHYIRGGLVGNDDPVLTHFTVQWGSEYNHTPLSPEDFVQGYVSHVLLREIALYEDQIDSLPESAVEYLSALRDLRENVEGQLQIYAVGVDAPASELIEVATHNLVELIDVVAVPDSSKIEYEAPRPF